MEFHGLATLNALLNGISATFLIAGFVAIKRGRREIHRRFMLAALTGSVLFLVSYVTYHFQVGSVPYPYYDWTRPLYFAILVPHVILACLMTPFVIVIVRRAWRGDFARHRRLARWVWPAWVFVSLSGVAVYLLLYR